MRWYAQKHNLIYIRAYPNFESASVLDEIAQKLRITRTRNYRALISMVRDALELRPVTIAVDEAQLLQPSSARS
ncbi:MAG: hypothetical protein HC933_00695 [Pleurocapsa sp. SU_196_0]|nr:hypothetical protein [Pleurocapsa sp. SU_196_0]